MIDLVIPKDNEKDFIKLAEQLGFKALCFLYDAKQFVQKKDKTYKTDLKIFKGILAAPKEAERMRGKADLLVVKRPADPKALRQIFERVKPDVLFALEESERGDYIYQRDSGINQVLGKIAKKNNTLVGFSLQTLNKKRPKMLGRMMQNVSLCRKFKVDMCLASFAKKPMQMRSSHDMKAVGIVLGMHPSEAKASLQSALATIKLNQKKKKGLYSKGVEVL